jgi:hypothetical protein
MDRAEQERRWYRARAKWEAAKLCSDQGFFNECVTLYHYACYQAMWIALGDPPAGVWRHGGLINRFVEGIGRRLLLYRRGWPRSGRNSIGSMYIVSGVITKPGG